MPSDGLKNAEFTKPARVFKESDFVPEPTTRVFKESDFVPESNISQGESVLRGAGQGATLGFGDELSALAGAIPSTETDEAMNRGYWDKYQMIRDALRKENEKAQAANPWSYGTGNVFGSVPLAVATGGVGAPAKGAGLGARLASAAKVGAGYGAAMGAGGSKADLTEGDIGGFSKDVGINTGIGAISSPLVSLGLEGAMASPGVARAGLNKIGNASNAVFTKLRGISPETPSTYMANKEAVNSIATSYDKLAEGQLANAQRVADEVNQARKMDVNQTLDNINQELNKAHAADRPVLVDDILKKIEQEKSGILPVGKTSKSAINNLDELYNDIQAMAEKNISRQPRDVILRRGANEVPSPLNRMAQNATETTPSVSYIPESTELISKNTGGALPGKANTNYALSNQAGDIKYVDPIMGPIKNRTPNQLVSNQGVQTAWRAPEDLIQLEIEKQKPFLTPKQLNEMRRNLNYEARNTYTNQVGQALPGSESIAAIGNTTRSALDEISPAIRGENQRLSNLFELEQGLKRGGLQEKDIPADKLAGLLTAGTKRAAQETPYIKGLDRMLGTNLQKERAVARAAQELHPEGVWSKMATGYSLAPAGAGLALSPFLGPLAPIIGGAGMVAQMPIMTKPLINLGYGSMGLARGGVSALEKVLQNMPKNETRNVIQMLINRKAQEQSPWLTQEVKQ